MLTDYILDGASVGAVLMPTNGFVVNLSRTAPPVYETPRWRESDQTWLAGYLQLKGANDFRDLICLDAANNGAVSGGRSVLAGASLGYSGGLVVRAVPKSSVWEITLSDQPYVKTRESFDDYITRISGRQPLPLEREPVPVRR